MPLMKGDRIGSRVTAGKKNGDGFVASDLVRDYAGEERKRRIFAV